MAVKKSINKTTSLTFPTLRHVKFLPQMPCSFPWTLGAHTAVIPCIDFLPIFMLLKDNLHHSIASLLSDLDYPEQMVHLLAGYRLRTRVMSLVVHTSRV